MRNPLLLMTLLILSLAPSQLRAQASGTNDGFVPLFNGRDLSGWVPVNVAPNTFTVKDGMIASTGFPTGIMRTERQYENFVLEFEWMHLKPKGNAGLFVWGAAMTAPGTPFARGIEVQVLDDAYVEGDARKRGIYTGHGDIFPIHGATMKPDRPHPEGWDRCLPSENRAKPAGEWNHYRVEANDGVIKLAVNGKIVSGGSACKPRKGYLCLESEGSPVLFRNIRIKELPSTNPKPDEVQPEAEDFRAIYTGISLDGWKREPGVDDHWTAQDWILNYDAKGDAAGAKHLWTGKAYGDFEMIVDWRLMDGASASGVLLRGSETARVKMSRAGGSGNVDEVPADASRAKADSKPGEWNRFHITMKGDRLTVVLNGKTVVEDAHLASVPARGPIGLQRADGPVQFANLFIKEVK